MRAVHVETYGTPDALTLVDRPLPTPGADEVLVRVHATPVTQGDRRVRAGDFPGIMAVPGRLAMGWSGPRDRVPGSMFAGVVEAAGAEVTRYRPGDRVFGASMHGAYADALVLGEDGPMAHIPDGVSFVDAAAVPFGAGTALPYLRDLGQVTPGDRVLIVGAAGGVGRYAVQVARALGARVTGVSRRDQAALVRSLGAHDVIVREDTDWREVDATWDVVFDTSDAFALADARPRLTPSGRFLTLGLTAWSDVWDLLVSRLRPGPVVGWTVVINDRSALEEVAAWLGRGALRPVVAERFPLDRIVDAHRLLEARSVTGEVMIEVVAPPRVAAGAA